MAAAPDEDGCRRHAAERGSPRRGSRSRVPRPRTRPCDGPVAHRRSHRRRAAADARHLRDAGIARAAADRWGSPWVEMKWDGIRGLGVWDGERLRLRSRNGNDLTAAYPELTSVDLGLRPDPAVFDGEIVALDDRGRPSFPLLQKRMNLAQPARSSVRRNARPCTCTCSTCSRWRAGMWHPSPSRNGGRCSKNSPPTPGVRSSCRPSSMTWMPRCRRAAGSGSRGRRERPDLDVSPRGAFGAVAQGEALADAGGRDRRHPSGEGQSVGDHRLAARGGAHRRRLAVRGPGGARASASRPSRD